MVKVAIYKDERYPDYGLTDRLYTGDIWIEISEEDLARFKASEEAYSKYQTELEELYKRQE